MSDLESELRVALRIDHDGELDAARTCAGVERRRIRRRRRRALGALAAAACVAMALLARQPSRPSRARPMFAMSLVGTADAATVPKDEALLRAALARYDEGDDEAAQALLQRLLEEHPGSRYLPDAAVGRAEHFFERGEMPMALTYLALVELHEDARVARFAHYKAGWAWWNLDERERAEAAFERAIAGGAADDRLVIEAKKDLRRLREQAAP
jgi:hypothetical protein